MGLWGYGVIGFYGYAVIGLWGFTVMRLWGYEVMGLWGYAVIGFIYLTSYYLAKEYESQGKRPCFMTLKAVFYK